MHNLCFNFNIKCKFMDAKFSKVFCLNHKSKIITEFPRATIGVIKLDILDPDRPV